MNKPLVGPEGSLESKICIIGEAPGAVEVARNRPFVGPSGQLLDKLLSSAGILRTSCYITNVVKEQPPGNNIALFLKANNKGGVKTTYEYDAYEHQLFKELEKCKANLYICAGNVGLYALTRKWHISKRRGSIMHGKIGDKDVKVLPIIHPAAALRDDVSSYVIALDLRRAALESNDSIIDYPHRNLIVGPLYNDVLDYLEEAKSHRILAVDIETTNDQIHCISIALTADRSMSIPFIDEQGNDYFTQPQEANIWLAIASILEDPNIVKVFQNAMFDAYFILERYGIITAPIEDTMLAQAIIAPDLPKGLDFITSVYTREPYYKDEGKKYMRIGGSLSNFWLYNAKDSAVCLEALPKLKQELVTQGNLEVYKRVLSILPVLLYMQKRGVRVDKAGLVKASFEAGKQIQELQRELNGLVGRTINYASVPQLKELFYKELGYRPYINRKTKAITTDEKALNRLVLKGSKHAELILNIRGLAKMKSTYFDMKTDLDGRMRGSYNPVTSSGRLASRQTVFGTGGNFQNMTHSFKQYLKADEGYILYEQDLSQAENRIVAYVAPEPTMITAFEQGIDVHKRTASLIFEIPENEVTPDQRQKGKVANHGLNYGMGYKRFSLEYGIPEREARFIVDRYHRIYPAIRRWHEHIKRQLQATRTLTNLVGRRRKFYKSWGDDLFQSAYNFIPQSTVGDKINRDGLIFIFTNQDLFYAVELLNQVHDSIVFQIPIHVGFEYHAQCLHTISESLSSPLTYENRRFSIPTETKIGLNMATERKLNTAVSIGELADEISNNYDTLLDGETWICQSGS